MTRRALVIGASGMVGARLSRLLSSEYEVSGTSCHRAAANAMTLDVRDRDAVRGCIERVDPDVVVLCAAISKVTVCESDPDGSAAVNHAGTVNVAECVGERTLVFYSTDAVFSDARPQWSETDRPDPRSAYGRQKAMAEEAVLACANPLVVRTARLYSSERGDGRFIDVVVRTLQEGGEVTAPLDTPGNPTWLDDLCSATAALLRRNERGIWHLAGPPVASLFHTACEVADVLGVDRRHVRAVPRDDGSPVPRVSARLDTSKAVRAGLHMRSLTEGLAVIRAAQRA